MTCINERTLQSLKPWTWNVSRHIVSDWEAATELTEQHDIPLIKVDKPLPAVISDQANYWTPINALVLLVVSLLLGYVAWIAAVGSAFVMWIYLAIFLVILIVACLEGRTIK